MIKINRLAVIICSPVILVYLSLAGCKAIPTVPPTGTGLPTISALTSSGGGKIAFSSWQENDWQIHVMNADGTGDRRVDNRHGYEPNWSPDGKKIVFQFSGFWIADVVSGVVTEVPLGLAVSDLPNEYLVKPAWSPDGQWIAFLNESGTEGDIYLVHPDGTGLQRLTSTGDISRDGNLVWSPDGKQIAYSAIRGGSAEIYLLDVSGALTGDESTRKLTNTAGSIRNLVTSWSSDGTWLAFSSDRDGNPEIYLIKPDGSNLVRLTDNPASDGEAAISPDGEQIAFSSDRDGDVEIYVLDVEGAIKNASDANARRITTHPGKDVGPVWMP